MGGSLLVSDKSIASKTGGCFSSSGTVHLEGGATKRLAEVAIGDRVLTVADGKLAYDDVIMFLHTDHSQAELFHQISTESDHFLSLTPHHLIYATDDKFADISTLAPIFAHRVQVGHYVFVAATDGSSRLIKSRVTSVTVERKLGVTAPLTGTGSLVVDGVASSCYAVIESQDIAHAVFAPVRLWHTVSSLWRKDASSNSTDSWDDVPPPYHGVHWYANILHWLAPYVIPEQLLYQS